MSELVVLGLTPILTALLLAGGAALFLLWEWLTGVGQRTVWGWFGHPWSRESCRLSREGRGGTMRLRGEVSGHPAAAAVAFPAGGAVHFHLGLPRMPRTLLQVRPRIPLPAGLEVSRGAGASEEDSVGPARVRTGDTAQTQALLADPGVRQALVTLVHLGEDAGIRDGVLRARFHGVLDAAELDAHLATLAEVAGALCRPAEDAWAALAVELGMTLVAGDGHVDRSAMGRVQDGLAVRVRVLVDPDDGAWSTRIRVGLPAGVPPDLTLAAPGTDVPHTLDLPEDHPLSGVVACGATEPDAAERLARPELAAGVEELIAGWPDTRVGKGHIEARLPGWSWHDLEDRILSMGVLAWLLAGEAPERIPQR
jgi:hypothetical protein